MAVYTEVDHDEAARLLSALGLGRLVSLRGIRAGIENSNFFATTDRGDFVLTVFERLPREELPYYLRLMRHLAAAGIPVPWPQGADEHSLVHTVAGKPAAVVTRLAGSPLEAPSAESCAAVGAMLGRMHRAAEGLSLSQDHGRGLAWWRQTLPQVLPHVGPEQASLLRAELQHQEQVAASAAGLALPRGAIHADLFRDNALFESTDNGPQLSGFLDFYFAGTDALLFDVAVCLNDWCIDEPSGRLDTTRAQALLDAYRRFRPFAHGEWRLVPTLLRAAALRFWISRLWDWHLPREASLLTPKDPTHFERILRERIDNPWIPHP